MAASDGGLGKSARLRVSSEFDVSEGGDGGWRLFELPEEMLSALSDGGSVTIKGSRGETAVMVTDSATYSIQKVESSNTHLLVPCAPVEEEAADGAGGGADDADDRPPLFDVACRVNSTFEVRKTAPRLDVLRELLSAVPYSGAEEDEERIETARHALNRHHATDEMEDGDVDPAAAESATEMTPSADDTYDPDTAHLTWGALVERIQASETELLAGLRDLGALEINGRWRVLAVEYFERVLDLVLALCVEKDWPISKVPASVCVEELDHLPGDVVRHCVASQGVMDGDGVCAFEPEKIALFRAKQLFRASKGRDWELRQFQRAWAESLPEHWEVPTPMSLLANEVLLESMGSQTALKPFSVSDLPASAAPRFAALFAARPAWTMEDLEPFVRDLVASGDGVADLMLKHCRSTLLPDGTREYTAR